MRDYGLPSAPDHHGFDVTENTINAAMQGMPMFG